MRKLFVLLACLLMPLTAWADGPPDWKKPSGIPPAGPPSVAIIQGHDVPAGPPIKTPESVTKQVPLNTELENIRNSLSKQLQDVEKYTAYLKGTTAKRPEDTQAQIDGMATILGNLADRLQPQGDLTTQLNALRNSASVHRKRVQEMAKEALEETDRGSLMTTWDKAIADADKTGAMLSNMRERVNGVLKKLRMRQAAVSEFLLAGEFQAALTSLKAWITELDTTVNALRQAIEPNLPAS